MLDSDVAAARDDRRVAEGFISPADARAFLEHARRGERADERDAITRAYFRGLGPANIETPGKGGDGGAAPTHGTELATAADVGGLMALLQEAQMIAPTTVRSLGALALGSAGTQPPKRDAAKQGQARLVAPLFEQAMSELRDGDPTLFSTRVRELGYLVNVWIAGGEHDGRRPRPMEALEMVLKTCETGVRTRLLARPATPERALAVLVETSADTLFRLGAGASGPGEPQSERA